MIEEEKSEDEEESSLAGEALRRSQTDHLNQTGRTTYDNDEDQVLMIEDNSLSSAKRSIKLGFDQPVVNLGG